MCGQREFKSAVHSRSLNRIFSRRIFKSQRCKMSPCIQQMLIRQPGYAALFESSLSAHGRRYFFARHGPNVFFPLWTQKGEQSDETCLYNFDLLKPYFYIVKLGFTAVYIIFLISAQKHRFSVLVRTASPRWFKRVPTIYVLSRNMKYIRNFQVLDLIFFYVHVFE